MKSNYEMSLKTKRVVTVNKLLIFSLVLLLFLNSSSAYNLFGIPLSWVSNLLPIVIFIFISFKSNLYKVPGTNYLILLILWSFSVTVFNVFFNALPNQTPLKGINSYEIFIILRYIVFFTVLSVIYIIYYLCKKGYYNNIIKIIVNIGIFVSFYAIYVYFAQILGLPEISRNRAGTSGGEQSTSFNYAFHRAMGSFREPSHLAQWLILPFFLSLMNKNKHSLLAVIIIGTTIMLTGSLTNIVGITVGSVVSFLLTKRFSVRSVKSLVKVTISSFFGILLFNLIIENNNPNSSNLISTLWIRIKPILEGGLGESNRGYIYDYVDSMNLPLVGVGVGNSNIELSKFLFTDVVSSYLSLFLNTLYSNGVIGLIFLVLFLGFPIYYFALNWKTQSNDLKFLVGAYIAWIIIYYVHAEELTISFGILYSLIVYNISKYAYLERTEGIEK